MAGGGVEAEEARAGAVTAKVWADYRIELPHGASGEVDTTCPECSAERKKKSARCLSVNTDKGTWTCHHCGWSGGLGEGGSRRELHWQRPPRRPDPLPAPSPSERTEAWFRSRGIPPEVLARNGVQTVRAYMPQTESHEQAVVFPYLRDGETINRKYRDGRKNFRLEPGCERILFGLDDLEPGETAVIVEGEIDKLSVEVAGITACVSVPDGAPTPNSKDYSGKFSFLDADRERIESVREWIIAVDDDEPGARLEDELARRLGRDKCRRVRWPQDCKDANEVLVHHGAETLRQCLDEAQPYPLAGVFEVEDLSAKIVRLRERGWERGVSTGWPCLDRYYTVRPGEFTVVSGIPGSGKSEWLDALSVNLAREHGWSFAMFSPENQPLEDHAARVIEKWAREPFTEGLTPRMSRETLDSGMAWAQQHYSWILPGDDQQWTLDFVLEAAKALVYRRGIRGLVIDPWNEMEHERPRDVTETEYVSRSLKRARQFARHHGVHVWMVVHPTKLYRDRDGQYPVPTLYDCMGSSHWRNKADNGIVIWRYYGEDRIKRSTVEVHVQKVRFRQIGQVGMSELRFDRATGTYAATGGAA
jgi:twinkle protein